MKQKIAEKREKILKAAGRLFESNGFHATGVDVIAAKAGITKRTLYKYFGSKEGLIEAVLQKYQLQMMEQIRRRVTEIGNNGAEQLLVCFDCYQEWFSEPRFAGCLFIKTLNEFQRCSDRLFAIARKAKSELRLYLVKLAKEAGAQDPELLASQLQLILEGSIVVAQCGREQVSIDTARALAERLVAEAFPPNSDVISL